MFCNSCGKENAGSASFCAHCGNRLTAAVGAPAGSPVAVGDVYAGFWKRLAALIVDYVILIVPNILLDSYLFGILTSWLYFAFMESSSNQATLGKMALGIKVVDSRGNRISFARATGRHFGKILSGLVLCIGYIIAGFTARKQALHDLMADCLVINKTASSDQLNQPVSSSTSGVIIAVVIAVIVAIPMIGILAAIALPAYQDYTVRARVAEAAIMGKRAAQAVDSFVAEHNTLPLSLEEAGFELASEYVENIELDQRGVIRLDLKVHPVERGALTFTRSTLAPDSGASWKCGSEEIDKKYLTVECR